MQTIRDYARQTGQCVQEVIQQAVDRLVGRPVHPLDIDLPDFAQDPLLSISGLADFDQAELSERTNEVLRDEIDPDRGWTMNRGGNT